MTGSTPAFGVYEGVVTHVRRRPRRHALRYRIFMLLLDLEQTPRVTGALRWLSDRRWAPLSFRERDHGDGSDRPLIEQVRDNLGAAGLPADGPVRLLTMPRVSGFVFNPLSVYFCHDASGRLAAVLYEVSNTFGQRHRYLAPVDGADGGHRHSADKRFYVSPFMDMDMGYRFALRPPGETFSLTIDVDDPDGSRLTAAFAARYQPLSDASLRAAWRRHPLLTIKVVAGIHWEALKIFLKGVGFRTRPPLPPEAVTPARPLSCPVHGASRHAA